MTRATTARRVAVGVALTGCVLAMAGCGSSASATQGSDLLTPDQAKGVALEHMQQPTYSASIKNDAGSLRAIEQAGLVVNPLPTPEPTNDPGVGHNVIVWVAHQSSYPLSFLAFDAPTVPGAQALPQLYHFTKASKTAPWAADFQVLVPASSAAPDVALDSKGYATAIPTSRYASFRVSPANLAKDFAAYLQAGNSADAHEFAPGQITSTVIDGDNKLVRDEEQQKGATATLTFTPTDDESSAYLLSDGSALVLVGVRSQTHVVAGKTLITATKDGKGVVGPSPGKYKDTTNELLLLAAFIDPPKGGTAKVTGFGALSGPVRSTATPA
jgi:hypothetical protein